MLIGQHVALHAPPRDGFIGMICTQLAPHAVAEDAIADARSICLRQYGEAPEVQVYMGNPDTTFAYVPGHLHQMVFELIKNSLRAVHDRWQGRPGEPPAIRLVIAEGEQDITVRISDEGGGIARNGLARIFSYLYTTARSPLPDIDPDDPSPAVLAGYGYGLPLSRRVSNAFFFGGWFGCVWLPDFTKPDVGPISRSLSIPFFLERLYARYFGGDLQVISLEGYGTDAFLHLNRLGNASEPLP